MRLNTPIILIVPSYYLTAEIGYTFLSCILFCSLLSRLKYSLQNWSVCDRSISNGMSAGIKVFERGLTISNCDWLDWEYEWRWVWDEAGGADRARLIMSFMRSSVEYYRSICSCDWFEFVYDWYLNHYILALYNECNMRVFYLKIVNNKYK